MDYVTKVLLPCLALFAVGLVFIFGWWQPNYSMWTSCGASATSPTVILRSAFTEPTLWQCAALHRLSGDLSSDE